MRLFLKARYRWGAFRFRRILGVFYASLALWSCSAQKEFSEMHDATVDMHQDTQQMNTKMDKMNDLSQQMGGVKKSMDGMDQQITKVSNNTDKMSANTDKMSGNTDDMKKDMTGMNTELRNMDGTMKGMAADTGSMNHQMGKLGNDMGGMKDQLTKTNTQMGAMAADTTSMRAQMGNMTGDMDELLDGNRQLLGPYRRNLLKAMGEEPEMYTRLVEAVEYFMGFEFQAWTGKGEDAIPNERERLLQDAADEFFLVIKQYSSNDGSVNPFAVPDPANPDSISNRRSIFNMLAMATHKNNRKQQQALDRLGDPSLHTVSMESIMEEALLAAPEINEKGMDYLGSKAGYIEAILNSKDRAIQILKARYQMFPLAFIDEVNNINGFSANSETIENGGPAGMGVASQVTHMVTGLFGTTAEQVLNKGWAAVKILNQDWNLDLDKIDLAKLIFIRDEILQPAVDTKHFMQKIHLTPVQDEKIAQMLKHMKVVGGEHASPAAAQVQQEVVGLVRELQ